MNNVQLMGNLAKDVELRYTKTGKPVAVFTIAATTTYVDGATGNAKEQTAFVNCVAWGKLGEEVSALRKGNRCLVHGRISTRSYEDKEGHKRYITEVIADFVGTSLSSLSTEASNFDSFSATDEDIPF